jgi:hypothetical protein
MAAGAGQRRDGRTSVTFPVARSEVHSECPRPGTKVMNVDEMRSSRTLFGAQEWTGVDRQQADVMCDGVVGTFAAKESQLAQQVRVTLIVMQ